MPSRLMDILLFSDEEMTALTNAQMVADLSNNEINPDIMTIEEREYYVHTAVSALERNIEVMHNELNYIDKDTDDYNEIMFYYKKFIGCLSSITNHH